MKKILSLILAFSFFASEASFMDKVKALPGKAKEFALATKDAAKANKPKAIFTTLQIAVAAHRLHALGMPESKRTLLTEDTNNFFSFGEYSPLGRKALEFTKIINFNFALGEESFSPVEEKLSSLGGKADNSGTVTNEVSLSENINISSASKEETSLTKESISLQSRQLRDKVSLTMVNENSENTGSPSSDIKKYSTEGEEGLSQATGETGNPNTMKNQVPLQISSTVQAESLMAGKDSFGVSKPSESRNKARPSNPDKIKNKNLRPIKYVQDFFNAGIGGTLFILEILKRLTTKAK